MARRARTREKKYSLSTSLLSLSLSLPFFFPGWAAKPATKHHSTEFSASNLSSGSYKPYVTIRCTRYRINEWNVVAYDSFALSPLFSDVSFLPRGRARLYVTPGFSSRALISSVIVATAPVIRIANSFHQDTRGSRTSRETDGIAWYEIGTGTVRCNENDI